MTKACARLLWTILNEYNWHKSAAKSTFVYNEKLIIIYDLLLDPWSFYVLQV